MVNTVTISVAGVLKSSTSPALDAVLRTADLLCSHNCSFAPFDQLLPTPPVLVWPLVAAWCWGGLAPESLWGWGPWGGHGLASPSCPQAGITLQWGHPGMQLTQVMGLPFWALQEPALTSVLPRGCDPSPGWTPRLPGGIFTCGWMILKRDMHWKPLSSILLMSSNHNLSCLPLVKLFFVFFLWTSHLFFFCPFRALRLC